MRLRIVCVAAVASLAFGLIGASAAGASTGTNAPQKATNVPPLYTLHVTGVAKNGKKFNGTYGIHRFVVATVKGNTGVYALGTLKGTLKGRHVTRYNVRMPASLTGPGNSAHDAQASCPVLHLVLGPINLNLLGLQVTIGGGTLANQPIVVDITAVPGPGNLLGNLLCDLTNALNGNGILTQLQSQLQQLQATLNSLIALLGSL